MHAPIGNRALSEFARPDYGGGGLLNLMATLANGLGAASAFPPLSLPFGIDADTIARTQKVALIVIDGLGDTLLDPAVTPTLAAHRIGRLTSVFPSTTASAVTTLLTALPPADHGLTGWHMWFEEIGRTLAALPLSVRGPALPEMAREDLPGRLFAHAPLSARIRRQALALSPQRIAGSPFNAYHSRGATTVPYGAAEDFFPRIAELVADNEGPLYLHAYLPDLDSLLHDVGTGDDRVKAMLARIDADFRTLLERLAGSGTLLMLTADHGFITAPPEHLIELDAHPGLAAMLARPLCGERRVAYAYVKPECRADFAAYVDERLGHACQRFRSEEFIADGWFGPPAADAAARRRLAARVADEVLLMRGDWTIKDWLPGEKRYGQLGVHGGASAAEMEVPLLVVRP